MQMDILASLEQRSQAVTIKGLKPAESTQPCSAEMEFTQALRDAGSAVAKSWWQRITSHSNRSKISFWPWLAGAEPYVADPVHLVPGGFRRWADATCVRRAETQWRVSESRLRLVTGCSPAHPAFITKAANQDAHSQCFRCQLMDQSWLPINCVSAKKRKKKGSTFDKLKHIWPQKELGGHFSMRHSCIFAGLNISDQLIVHLHGVTPGLVPRLFQKHIKSARGVFT